MGSQFEATLSPSWKWLVTLYPPLENREREMNTTAWLISSSSSVLDPSLGDGAAYS